MPIVIPANEGPWDVPRGSRTRGSSVLVLMSLVVVIAGRRDPAIQNKAWFSSTFTASSVIPERRARESRIWVGALLWAHLLYHHIQPIQQCQRLRQGKLRFLHDIDTGVYVIVPCPFKVGTADVRVEKDALFEVCIAEIPG